MEPNIKADQNGIVFLEEGEGSAPLSSCPLPPSRSTEVLHKAPRASVEEDKISSILQGSSGWSKTESAMRQINVRKSNLNTLWDLRGDQGGQVLYFLDKET